MLQISFRELKPQSSTDVERRRDQRKKHKVSQYIPFLNRLVTKAFLVCTYQIRVKHSQCVVNFLPVLLKNEKVGQGSCKRFFNFNFYHNKHKLLKTNVHAIDNLKFNFDLIFKKGIYFYCYLSVYYNNKLHKPCLQSDRIFILREFLFLK